MFPYVVIYGEVRPAAIDQLCQELIAFDEVHVEPGVLEFLRPRPDLPYPENTLDVDEVGSLLLDGREPLACRGLLAAEPVLRQKKLLFCWDSLLGTVRYFAGRETNSYLWLPDQYAPRFGRLHRRPR